MIAFLAKPLVKYGALALVVIGLVIGVVLYIDGVRKEGRKDGAAGVTNAVQQKQIETTTKAQQRKDKVDDEVAKTPYKDAVDKLD